MVSRRSAVLSLSMIVLMLAVPWTVIADSSSRDGEEPSEEIRISTSKNSDGYSVDVVVEFENVTGGNQYDYSVWFTRVDPNFSHETLIGNFTCESNSYELDLQWTPDQEGPYTVHASLSWYGSVIETANDTFDWGDVANNSHPPVVEITVDYEGDEDEVGIEKVGEWYYLDIYENESLQENITIGFDAGETETGADYQMNFALYKLGAQDESEQFSWWLG